jgi:hypothetical protein
MGLERGPQGSYEAYNELAFRHFLALERRRAERSARSLLLLLLDLDADAEGGRSIEPAAGSALLAALSDCVREIDFIGWYRVARIVGAVLTQGPEEPAPDAAAEIADRVSRSLRTRLPKDLGSRIHVRILQLRSSVRK